MKIRLVKSWATPSTLHLSVMITAKDGSWSQFRELHIPIRDLDESVLRTLLQDHPEDGSDQPLPGMPYTAREQAALGSLSRDGF